MIKEVREAFNIDFKQEYYENLQNEIERTLGERCAFRISETPVFISKEIKKRFSMPVKAFLIKYGSSIWMPYVNDSCQSIFSRRAHWGSLTS
ncbi:hypothetical protein [Maribacter halichondriae]|uniref:hypothetical protein n=1 Tax=Maribacter halichondriae TaxID=2980554 RepID=UPI002358F037|nr:hypothetical protein [Maribacter sp. Hal144]